MVRFLPFDCTDEEGINIVLQHIDFSIQYGEDLDFKEPKVSSLKASQEVLLLVSLLVSERFLLWVRPLRLKPHLRLH